MTLTLRHGDFAELPALEALIPEFDRQHPLDDCLRRVAGRDALLLVAEADGRIQGFKAGYAVDAHCFYSWMGGVVPAARRSGVAQRLLTQQEAWARSRGYRSIRVKSYPRYPAMLAFLARNGYALTPPPAPQHDDALFFEKPL